MSDCNMVVLSLEISAVSIEVATSLVHSFPSSPSSSSTGAIVKHWPESRALKRLRGSGLTDRWISPQAPRMGIVREAFLSL